MTIVVLVVLIAVYTVSCLFFERNLKKSLPWRRRLLGQTLFFVAAALSLVIPLYAAHLMNLMDFGCVVVLWMITSILFFKRLIRLLDKARRQAASA